MMTPHVPARYPAYAESVTDSIGPDERAAIPILECGEPLVDIGMTCPTLSVRLRIPERRAFAGDERLLARETVCGMLNQLATGVAPEWRVEVFDAYRPLKYQRWRYEQVRSRITSSHVGLSENELTELVDRYVALPSENLDIPPPHTTGGALDMLLVSSAGVEPPYGSLPGVYLPDENMRHPTNSPLILGEERSNRLRLLRAAIAVGFANYPGEWWHFSFGDQEWCYQTKAEYTARYGRIGP